MQCNCLNQTKKGKQEIDKRIEKIDPFQVADQSTIFPRSTVSIIKGRSGLKKKKYGENVFLVRAMVSEMRPKLAFITLTARFFKSENPPKCCACSCAQKV